MSLRRRIAAIVDGMPPDARVSLSVSWLRRVLEEEPEDKAGNAVLTLATVADRLGVAESTVRTWCNSGRLEGFKLNGRAWRVRESALEAYLRHQENGGDPNPSGGAEEAEATDLGAWRRHFEGGDAA